MGKNSFALAAAMQRIVGWDFVSVVGFGQTPTFLQQESTGAKLQVGLQLLSKQTPRPLTDGAARCLPSASAQNKDAGLGTARSAARGKAG